MARRNAGSYFQRTALHGAALGGDTKIITYLLYH